MISYITTEKLLHMNTMAPTTEMTFHHVEDLENDDGYCNEGISIYTINHTDKLALCKGITIDDADQVLGEHPPDEVEVHKYLSPHPSIPQFFKYNPPERDPPRDPQIGRIYMEYCDRGSLLDLERLGNQLPEAFIWHVLESLLKAFCWLHHGIRDPSHASTSAPDPNWYPVLHKDLKTANVFLTNSDSGSVYPRVLLADFGNSSFVNSPDELTVEVLDVLWFVIGPLCLPDYEDDFKPGMGLTDFGSLEGWGYSDDLRGILNMMAAVQAKSIMPLPGYDGPRRADEWFREVVRRKANMVQKLVDEPLLEE
jgi:hypothetical protein